MNEAERRIAEHDNMMVENDPLFQIFIVVEMETREGRRLILTKRDDGAGIRMPEPGEACEMR